LIGAGNGTRSTRSAVASAPGWRSAVLACDTSLQEARRQALATCRQQAGCDCTLVGSYGINLNTSRQPQCSAAPGARARGSLLETATGEGPATSAGGAQTDSSVAPRHVAHPGGRNAPTDR